MYIRKLSLLNFKNIAQADLELAPGINCFTGRNGAGKTNVIDAVWYLAMCKSSLAMTDGQSVRHDEEFFLLNSFISQNDREYLNALIRYNHALAERNRLLKQLRSAAQGDLLEVFDMQLEAHGRVIHAKRAETIEKLGPIVARHYRAISGDREKVELSYRSELNGATFGEVLAAARDRDIANQFTTSGVHRDDMVMRIGGYPLKKYGSQGQQKSFLIARHHRGRDRRTPHPASRRFIRQAGRFASRSAHHPRRRRKFRTDRHLRLQPYAADLHTRQLRSTLYAFHRGGGRDNRGEEGSMRRSRPMSIGELWSGFVEENPTRMRRLAEARIPDLWPEVVGPGAASLTRSLTMRNGVLYVALTSSVARHDIFMRRTELRHRLNELLGMNVVSNIIVK